MNYRHSYHAGNFADVLKHAVLASVIQYLKRKPAPFRFIDTHAGLGVYDLASAAAMKTDEWRDGVAKLLSSPLPEAIEQVLSPYLSVVRPLMEGGANPRYPGSPALAASLMRATDRLVLNELHPDDHQSLAREFAADRRAKVLCLDGWTAVRALLPPPERRGLVLIDPPFELAGEFDRMVEGVRDGLARFATGVYLLWYPLKARAAAAGYRQGLAELKHRAPGIRIIDVEFFITRAGAIQPGEGRLAGCGLTAVNPPYSLEGELQLLLPFLAERIGSGDGSFAIRDL